MKTREEILQGIDTRLEELAKVRSTIPMSDSRYDWYDFRVDELETLKGWIEEGLIA